MSIEYANLEELCHIKTGAPMARARKIPEGGEARSVRALPPRSLQGGSIVDDELVTEEVGEINKEHFTREGDVVIKLSTPYDSAYIDKDHEGILVTSLVMHPSSSQMRPSTCSIFPCSWACLRPMQFCRP